MKKLLATLLAVAMAVAPMAAIAAEKTDAKLANAQMEFGFNLLRKLAGDNKNIVISPYSIEQALELTMTGTKGNTFKQMVSALKLKKLNNYAENSGKVIESLNAAEEVKIANALFVKEGFELNASFLKAAQNYKANASNIDFTDEKSTGIINDWVKKSTDGKIDKLYDTIDPAMAMIIANAVSFEAEWMTKFDSSNTRKEDFNGLKKKASVDMMYRSGSMAYAETNRLQVVSLPYEGGRFSMLVAVPKGKTSMKNALKHFTVKNVNKWMDAAKYEIVNIYLPRFTVESSLELKTPLASLGIKDAFDAKKADLSGIAGGKGDLVVNEVRHKAMIEVTEDGTKAAAVTAVEILPTSAPGSVKEYTVRADKPFIYAIYDEDTRAVLFAGVVYDM